MPCLLGYPVVYSIYKLKHKWLMITFLLKLLGLILLFLNDTYYSPGQISPTASKLAAESCKVHDKLSMTSDYRTTKNIKQLIHNWYNLLKNIIFTWNPPRSKFFSVEETTFSLWISDQRLVQ